MASSPQERERRAMVHFRAAVTALIWSLWLFGEQRKRDLTFPRRREEGGIEKGEMGCGQRTKGGLFSSSPSLIQLLPLRSFGTAAAAWRLAVVPPQSSTASFSF